MDLRHFADESAVHRQVNKQIYKILSDKSYTNPQKLSLLINDYEKKQLKYDGQLSKIVSFQIQSITQSRTSVLQANNWMKEANEKTLKLKELWNEQYGFHELLEDIKMLNVFQNNVGKVIEQLTYFIDMEQQMSKLQKMAEDQGKYQTINLKLLNLIALRDALLEDSSWKGESAIMRKQFMKVNNFQTYFYDKICNVFNDCIRVGKESPTTLSISVKVIEAYDKAQEQKGKPRVKRDQIIQIIIQSIDDKFTEKLHGEDSLIGIIEKAQFATTDLIDVGDYVVPLFPSNFPIMEIYQKQYQQNIEKHIFPFFDQIQEQNQYGELVSLLGWIDDYETMLSRAGLDSTNLIHLKTKVKILMPYFIDHNQKILSNYIEKSLLSDQQNYNRKYYHEVLMDGSDLVSLFPSDIFRLINNQAELIKDRLKGEIFIQFVRCITETVNFFQKDLAQRLVEEFEVIKMVMNEEKIVDFQYKCLLFVNNYNECLRHAGQSKELFADIVTEDYKHRIEKIFMNQLQKQFNASIPIFINLIVRIIYLNIVDSLFPQLFTHRWLTDNSRQFLSKILKNVTDQLNDVQNQNLLVSLIHYRMLVKECLEFLINAYTEQLILKIKAVYNLQAGQEKFCNFEETKKKVGEDPEGSKKAFQSKSQFSEGIKKDKLVFLKCLESFSECTSKTFVNKMTMKFVILGELFTKKKSQYESILTKMAEIFPEQAADLAEVVFLVRDDMDTKANIQKKYN